MSGIHLVIIVAVGLGYVGLMANTQINMEGLTQHIDMKCDQNLYDFINASMDLEVAQICVEHNACYTDDETDEFFKAERDKLDEEIKKNCKSQGAWKVTLSTLTTWVNTLKTKSEALGRLKLDHKKDLNCETNGDNLAKVMDHFLDVARFMICAWQEICFTPDEYKGGLAEAKADIMKEFRESGCKKMTDMQKEQEHLFMTFLGHISKEAQSLGKAPQTTGEDLVEVEPPVENSYNDDDDDDDDDDEDGVVVVEVDGTGGKKASGENKEDGNSASAIEELENLFRDFPDGENLTSPFTDSDEPLDLDKVREQFAKLRLDDFELDDDGTEDLPGEQVEDRREQQQVDKDDIDYDEFFEDDHRVPKAFNSIGDLNLDQSYLNQATLVDKVQKEKDEL